MTTRDDDALLDLVVVDTHDTLFFFSNKGRVYPLRAFQIPGDTSRTARGTLLVNLISLAPGERVQAMLVFQKSRDDLMILATRLGEVKALRTEQLANIQSRGLIVMDLEQGDELVSVALLGDATDIIMVSEKGQAIRFPVSNLTPRSRAAGGVRGIRLLRGDRVVSMGAIIPNGYLLVVSQGGYGKPTLLSRYPRQARGGQGVRTFRVTAKTGRVAAARIVPGTAEQEIFIISAKAQVIRITLADVRVTGRNTQGVIIWRDREPDDRVASIACIQENHRAKDDPDGNGNKTLSKPKPPSGSLNGGPPAENGASGP